MMLIILKSEKYDYNTVVMQNAHRWHSEMLNKDAIDIILFPVVLHCFVALHAYKVKNDKHFCNLIWRLTWRQIQIFIALVSQCDHFKQLNTAFDSCPQFSKARQKKLVYKAVFQQLMTISKTIKPITSDDFIKP